MSKLIRRYRKDNLNKATRLFEPVFSIDVEEVLVDLIEGRG